MPAPKSAPRVSSQYFVILATKQGGVRQRVPGHRMGCVAGRIGLRSVSRGYCIEKTPFGVFLFHRSSTPSSVWDDHRSSVTIADDIMRRGSRQGGTIL